MITVEPGKVSAILLEGSGWETIVVGSLTIDTIQLIPSPAEVPESEDYGFVAVLESGAQVMGRMSALLATKRTAR